MKIMKQLSKSDQKERDEFIAKLRARSQNVEDMVEKVNEAIEALNEVIAEYNATVNDANEWSQNLVTQMEEYRNAKSEKWIDSDTGQQYDSWIQSWADDVQEVDPIDTVNVPDMEGADLLEQRTVAPDEM